MIHKLYQRSAAAFAALLLIISSIVVPVAPVFAAEIPTGYQPVWCQYTNDWSSHIGSSEQNQNRFKLKTVPEGSNPEIFYDPATDQVYAPNRSDPALKRTLDTLCQTQFTAPTPAITATVLCGALDTIAYTNYDTTKMTLTSSGWTGNTFTATFTAISPYRFAVVNGNQTTYSTTATFTYTDNGAACPVAAQPTISPVAVCGPANDRYTLNYDATVMDVTSQTWNGNTLTVVFTINSGSDVVFSNGTKTTTVTYTDLAAPCPAVPAAPAQTVVCGPMNDTLIFSYDTTKVTLQSDSNWVDNSNGTSTRTIVFVPKTDATFADGSLSKTYTFTDAATAGCQAAPARPAVSVVCGPSNDIITHTNYDTATIRMTDSGWVTGAGGVVSRTITYAPINQPIFSNGQAVVTYVFIDAATTCPAPSFVPATCTAKAQISLPSIDEGYYYAVTVGALTTNYFADDVPAVITINGYPEVTVALYHGTVLLHTQVDSWSETFEAPDCPVVVPTPKVIDICGADNAIWAPLADQPQDSRWTWSIVDSHLIATTTGNYTWAGETDGTPTTHDFGLAVNLDSNVLCEPSGEPTHVVICGTDNNDSVTLPKVAENAHYSWVSIYNDKTSVITVTAVADEGYSFAEGTQTVWTFTDTHTTCPAPVFTPTDCFTATGSVTVTFDDETYFYTVSGPGLDGEVALTNGVTKYLAQAGDYTVTAYTTDGEGLVTVGTWTHTYPVLNCTPGKGETLPTPPLPQLLPHTGPSDTTSPQGLLLALIAAIATYGALYFAQGKRRFEQ